MRLLYFIFVLAITLLFYTACWKTSSNLPAIVHKQDSTIHDPVPISPYPYTVTYGGLMRINVTYEDASPENYSDTPVFFYLQYVSGDSFVVSCSKQLLIQSQSAYTEKTIAFGIKGSSLAASSHSGDSLYLSDNKLKYVWRHFNRHRWSNPVSTGGPGNEHITVTFEGVSEPVVVRQ